MVNILTYTANADDTDQYMATLAAYIKNIYVYAEDDENGEPVYYPPVDGNNVEDVIEIINMPHIMNMLKSSSKYLAQHSRMPKHVMNDLLATAKSEGEILQDNKTYYRDIVKNL